MSVLRFLNPARATSSYPPTCPSSSTGSKNNKITVEIQLLTNGTILMDPPDDPLWPHGRSAGPRDDQLLNGVVEIQLPRGTTKRRCKSVRVGVRTRTRMDMGPGRGVEEDIIFERKVEMMGGNSDGIVLDEGMQRFEFTLIIPSTFAPHDWHPNGSVKQELFAELEGQPKPPRSSSPFGLFGRSNKRDKTERSSRTPSRSPSPTSPASLSPILGATDNLSITRQEQGGLPAVPSYNESQADALGQGSGSRGDDWIIGLHEGSRNIQVTHNPNPTGNFSDLDQTRHGFADGLGVWELKMMTDVFSAGGPIHTRLTLPAPNALTTVFSWTVRLKQTHTMTSPRDPEDTKSSVTNVTYLDVATFGTTPPRAVQYPDSGTPALWRGKEAGGISEGRFLSEGNAFMPKHDQARPTTLPGLVTPIQVSHALVCEVYFSVWGEDAQGVALPQAGPGGLRFLQINKPIILPSCSLIPARLDVPNYAQSSTDKPCDVCGHRFSAQICVTCPPTYVPHPRHDLPDAKNQEDGYCLACYKRFEPVVDPYEHEMCACLLDIGDVEVRMARFWDAGAGSGEDQGDGRMWVGGKTTQLDLAV